MSREQTQYNGKAKIVVVVVVVDYSRSSGNLLTD
jgi:hypothetical protein